MELQHIDESVAIIIGGLNHQGFEVSSRSTARTFDKRRLPTEPRKECGVYGVMDE